MEYLESLIIDRPWLTLVWYGIVGSCVGSFLNVVVYRLPNRMSLIHPGSHCPNCKHKIRWYHNLPVVGWIMLRGKCKDCRQKISPRYPLVELVTGLAWAAIFYVNLIAPNHTLLPNAGPEIQVNVAVTPQLLLMVLVQSLLVSFIIACALIMYDKLAIKIPPDVK
jgi:prepilin signal peptidase PulO-like enzyme (type II secretory pathway)